jgi:putative heme-binding domain-containing protein
MEIKKMNTLKAALVVFGLWVMDGIALAEDAADVEERRRLHLAMSVSSPEPDNSVEAELKSFELNPDYEVQLFADEKDGIANPVCMSWDPAGRLWVLCTLAYPQLDPSDTPNDQLLILEDTNGDGRADKTTVFADGLNMPTGFALGHGGAYIGQGNDLLHLEDSDGDDKADSRRVLLTGFGTGDTHQNINSFTWSPGGELHFCQGLHSFSRIETPWGISRLDEHGSWRLRPLRLELDGYRRTSSGGNPWGIVYGNWGEPFIKSNGPGISELLPGMVSTERTESFWGGEMQIGNTEIKSMIIEFAESPHLPNDIQGEMLIAGYFARDINRFKWEVDGSGHKLTNEPDLLTSSHNAFRPVDIRIGPDGAIYIADWFNPIIGHYQASFRHPDRDMTHGRIWRVTAKGHPLAKAPSFAEMDADELCEQLSSDWRYVRYQAKRRLADLPKDEAIPAVSRWVGKLKDQDLEHHLYEAIGVFESHEEVNRPLLERLLGAKDYRARAYATRVAGRWHDRLEAPLQILEKSVGDENARVRLEAIVACSDVHTPESMVVAAKALDRSMDRFLQYALRQTAHALTPYWRPAVAEASINFEQVEHLIYVLKETADKSTVDLVRALLKRSDLKFQDIEKLMTLLIEIGTPQDLRWVVDRAWDKPAVLDALVETSRIHGLIPTGDLIQVLNRMMGSGNQDVQVRAIRLAGLWQVESLAGPIKEVLNTESLPATVRSEAIESLGHLLGQQAIDEAIEAIIDPASEIRQAALRALCELNLSRAAQLANGLLREAISDEVVHSIVTPFLGHKEGLHALTSALGGKPVDSKLATRIRGLLGSVGRYDPALDQILRAAENNGSVGIPDYSGQYVRSLATEVMESGDRQRGEEVYASATLSCMACHKVGNTGGDLGPELTAVGAGVPVELLIEAILWPKRQVKEGYLSTTLSSKNGNMVSGYVHTEDEHRVVIRNAVTGELQTVPANQIQTREDAGTLMPPGLTAGLMRSELRDLIRYLSELKGRGTSD